MTRTQHRAPSSYMAEAIGTPPNKKIGLSEEKFAGRKITTTYLYFCQKSSFDFVWNQKNARSSGKKKPKTTNPFFVFFFFFYEPSDHCGFARRTPPRRCFPPQGLLPSAYPTGTRRGGQRGKRGRRWARIDVYRKKSGHEEKGDLVCCCVVVTGRAARRHCTVEEELRSTY